MLVEIEEAYTISRYGERGYTLRDAGRFANLAKKLIKLLEEVAKGVKMG